MRGFIKTLFGDARTLCVAAICILLAVLILHSPYAIIAGIALPVTLLIGAAYLAKH
jgi:hypothetical protein